MSTCMRHNFCIRAPNDVFDKLLERSWSVDQPQGASTIVEKFLTPKITIWCLKMDLEGFKPQFSKLGPVVKMTLKVDSSDFFHSKSIEIYEN
jgi:hypothetical protein